MSKKSFFPTVKELVRWAAHLARQARDQAVAAGVPFFLKTFPVNGKASKNIYEWPKDLRIRQVPNAV
jgi:hypothetical protein